jgi:hypothetical protein
MSGSNRFQKKLFYGFLLKNQKSDESAVTNYQSLRLIAERPSQQG